MLKREDLAWSAGFFSGEGCTTTTGNKKRPYYPRLRVGQSGDNANLILERFRKSVLDIGKIYGPYKVAKNQRKVRWVYEAHGLKEVQAVIALLWIWLSEEKKIQATKILKEYCHPLH